MDKILDSVRACIPALILLSANGAWSQESTQNSAVLQEELDASASAGGSGSGMSGASASAASNVEKMQVTGSHIKRIDIEGPSPIQVLDREALEQSGYNSVSDILRETTVNSFGSIREDSGSNAAGVATVNLRGLGSSKTLVLLNGHRLPRDAVVGSVDLNLIPMAAVERIEILKDGASATYGSDALGGVVNIITKKDYDGMEIDVTRFGAQLEGGEKLEASLTAGKTFAKGNVVAVATVRRNDRVFDRDRPWTDNQFSTIGSPGSSRIINADGTKGNWTADSSCAPEDVITQGPNTFCRFKFSDYSTALPFLEQYSGLADGNFKIAPGLSLFARVNASLKKVKWSYAPAPGTFTVSGAGPAGEDLEVRYRTVELGTRDTEVKEDSVGVQSGLKGEIGETWEWQLSNSVAKINKEDVGVRGYGLASKLEKLISEGDFDPSAPEGERGSLASAAYQPWERSTSEVINADLNFNGELIELNGNAVGLALGVNMGREEFSDRVDDASSAGEVFGGAGSNGAGKRITQSAYSELAIPLMSTVELQAAGRYDKYSDFGDTFNPKFGARVQLSPAVLLRSSWGTGFKAPSMNDLYASSSFGFPTFIDAVACNQEKQAGGATPSCLPAQYNVLSGGNPHLREEKSRSFNVGTVIQPAKRVAIGADFFTIKMNNVVGINYDEAMKAEAAGVDLAKYGVIVNRDSNGYINQITAPLQNLSAQQVEGLDLNGEVGTYTKIGDLKLRSQHSLLLAFREEGFPGTGLKNKLGENGMPSWRNASTLSLSPGNHTFALTARSIGGHEKAVKEQGNLPAHTEFDFQYNLRTKWKGEITFGVTNLFGKTPPLDDSNPNEQLDVDIYDQIGRTAYVGYRQVF